MIGQTSVVPHPAGASGYRQLYSFKGGSDGYWPVADLIAVNGKLYGTTEQGGRASCVYDSGCGTVFQVGPDGTHHVIYRFLGYPHDGEYPEAGFILVNGKLYSTTEFGSATVGVDDGTVYEIDTSGKERVVHSFSHTYSGNFDGSQPVAGLTEYRGILYGTTLKGGLDDCYLSTGCGTVFEITLPAKEKVLHDFRGVDGWNPKAGLTPVKNLLYGTTQYGGISAGGNVFSITPSGKERAVHTFPAPWSLKRSDGYYPEAQITSLQGELYGTTLFGGAYGLGTVFAISPSGKERIVHSFKGSPNDGAVPMSRLILVNGEFYGTTNEGGAHQCKDGGYGCGTIFKMSPSGKESVLYSFAGVKDGEFPVAALEDLNGTLYGTTPYGGAARCSPPSNVNGTGCGTIFSIVP